MVFTIDATVQLVRDMVNESTAENPATPSKVAAVEAGATDWLPVPLQVPEMSVPDIAKVSENPFATNDLYALCKGKDKVEATGADELLPPKQPLKNNTSKTLI